MTRYPDGLLFLSSWESFSDWPTRNLREVIRPSAGLRPPTDFRQSNGQQALLGRCCHHGQRTSDRHDGGEEDDFKKAARRLGDIGVFTDIAYNYSYSSAGTKLVLQVTDVEKFVPVRFEDFVWFSDEELVQRIKERAPMFNGELPLSGSLPDRVSDVLQALLVENAIPGNVEYERAGKANGPMDAIVYRVSEVVIQIRNVEFTGATEAELPALKEAARRVFDREYSRSVLNALVEHQLFPVYYTRGYLKAAFGEPQPKVVKKPSADSEEGTFATSLLSMSLFRLRPAGSTRSRRCNGRAIRNFPPTSCRRWCVRSRATSRTRFASAIT